MTFRPHNKPSGFDPNSTNTIPSLVGELQENQSMASKKFLANWQFIFQNFHLLYIRLNNMQWAHESISLQEWVSWRFRPPRPIHTPSPYSFFLRRPTRASMSWGAPSTGSCGGRGIPTGEWGAEKQEHGGMWHTVEFVRNVTTSVHPFPETKKKVGCILLRVCKSEIIKSKWYKEKLLPLEM